jgi:hypothetical protein
MGVGEVRNRSLDCVGPVIVGDEAVAAHEHNMRLRTAGIILALAFRSIMVNLSKTEEIEFYECTHFVLLTAYQDRKNKFSSSLIT